MKKSFIDKSTLYLDYAKEGKTLNKLGVENSLWNNIRAKKGSGKKPTKEMLKQEKKIKAKAPDGITLEDEIKPFQPATSFNSAFDPMGKKPNTGLMLNNMPNVNNINKPSPVGISPKEITPLETTNKMTKRDAKKLGKSMNDAPNTESNPINPTPYFLGGLAAANLLLPDANRETDENYYNRPENERYYNPYPNGTNSGALAKHGKTIKMKKGGNLQLLSEDNDIEQISPTFTALKDGKHGVKNSDGSEGIPLSYGNNMVEAEQNEIIAEHIDKNGQPLATIFSPKTIDPVTKKSFKSLTQDLSKFENKYVTKAESKVEKLLDEKPLTSDNKFDQLTLNTAKLKMMGIDKAKQFVDVKTNELAERQNLILNIAEQTGLSTEQTSKEMSKQMKTAKYGMTIANKGKTLTSVGDPEEKEYKGKKYRKEGKDFTDGSYKRIGTEQGADYYERPGDKRSWKPVPKGWTKEQLAAHNAKKRAGYKKEDRVFVPSSTDKGEIIPTPLNVKPGGIVPKGEVTPIGNIQPLGKSYTTDDKEKEKEKETLTEIQYDNVRNGNWKNYVGPVMGLLDRVNNRSDQPINPRLKDVGEFENLKLAQINSKGRAFQQAGVSTGASAAELATGMGGFAEQAAGSEAEIQAFNQGNKNTVYNENIGIINDAQRFNSGINTRNNERRLMAEGNTKTRNIEALNTIGKYSAMEDRDRNAFSVNKGYYPTFNNDRRTLQPVVRPGQNPFDNDAIFQTGAATKTKTKSAKYGMSLVKEFKRYKS